MVFGVVKDDPEVADLLPMTEDDPEVADLLPMTDIEEVGCGKGRRISEKGIPPAASTRRILDLQSVALVLPDHACRFFAAELGSSATSNCLRMGEQISGGSGLRFGSALASESISHGVLLTDNSPAPQAVYVLCASRGFACRLSAIRGKGPPIEDKGFL
jgi:hypothetical protein